jgi:hypothetical protein
MPECMILCFTLYRLCQVIWLDSGIGLTVQDYHDIMLGKSWYSAVSCDIISEVIYSWAHARMHDIMFYTIQAVSSNMIAFWHTFNCIGLAWYYVREIMIVCFIHKVAITQTPWYQVNMWCCLCSYFSSFLVIVFSH